MVLDCIGVSLGTSSGSERRTRREGCAAWVATKRIFVDVDGEPIEDLRTRMQEGTS